MLLLLPYIPVKAQMPDSVKNFIGKALNLMEQHSVFSAGRLNWKICKDTANALSINATTFRSGTGHSDAFNALGDKHGWLVWRREYRNRLFGRIPYISQT
ncbi:MAG: hypothetical protein IPH68_15600 [Chitinophagaceae bacterium]|nr:hypothetical protein [Chitinophagaceae bacterium]